MQQLLLVAAPIRCLWHLPARVWAVHSGKAHRPWLQTVLEHWHDHAGCSRAAEVAHNTEAEMGDEGSAVSRLVKPLLPPGGFGHQPNEQILGAIQSIVDIDFSFKTMPSIAASSQR